MFARMIQLAAKLGSDPSQLSNNIPASWMGSHKDLHYRGERP
jgi:hypothetical protein